MCIEGSLSKWNDDRGFGFITPTEGGHEIFVHISAFPKDGVRPSLGEKLTFEIEADNNGKKASKEPVVPPTTDRCAQHTLPQDIIVCTQGASRLFRAGYSAVDCGGFGRLRL